MLIAFTLGSSLFANTFLLVTVLYLLKLAIHFSLFGSYFSLLGFVFPSSPFVGFCLLQITYCNAARYSRTSDPRLTFGFWIFAHITR